MTRTVLDLIDQLEDLCDDQRDRVAGMFNKLRSHEVKRSGDMGFLVGTLTGLRYRVDGDTRQVIDNALQRVDGIGS